MEKLHLYTYSFIFFIVLSLALLTFIFCVLAEFKKSKLKDVKIDGRLCQLPESEAFWYGVAAIICVSVAQIIGNSIIFVGCTVDSKERRSCCQPKMPTIATIFLFISWINFVISIMLISTTTSMSKRQLYGKGWLDGECYLVKDGVFVGAAILVQVTLGCTLTSLVLTLRKRYEISVDENPTKSGHISEIR